MVQLFIAIAGLAEGNLGLVEPVAAGGCEERLAVRELDSRHIQHVLDTTGGKIGVPGGAAEILGMKRATLNKRLKRLSLR